MSKNTPARLRQLVDTLAKLITAMESNQRALDSAEAEKSALIAIKDAKMILFSNGQCHCPEVRAKLAEIESANQALEKSVADLREVMPATVALAKEIFEPLLEQARAAATTKALPYCHGVADQARHMAETDWEVSKLKALLKQMDDVRHVGALGPAKLALVHFNEWLAAQNAATAAA